MQRLGIKAAGAEQKIHELGRQSAEGPSAMAVQEHETSFLDEPTRGIDVGAKGDPAAHRRTGGAGWALMISSEWKSSLKAHSVVVLRDGRSAELSGEQKNTKAILHAMAEGADRKEAVGG